MYHISQLSRIDLVKIRGLWEMLNAIHHEDSVHFKDHYSTYTFESRCKSFEKIEDEDLRIFIATSENTMAPVAYIVATVKGSTGEIESVMVDPDHQRTGLGKKLVARCTDWFSEKGCTKVVVSVTYGHESVFPFYRDLGFFPRSVYLELKDWHLTKFSS